MSKLNARVFANSLRPIASHSLVLTATAADAPCTSAAAESHLDRHQRPVYCFEVPRNNSAHSNSVRNPVTSGAGSGGGAVVTVPSCFDGAVTTPPIGSEVGCGIGADAPTRPGVGGEMIGVASSRHLTILPGLVRK